MNASVKWWLGVAAAVAAACGARGGDISLEQAEKAVGNWVARGGGFGAFAGDGGVSGKTWEDGETGAKLHVLRLGGNGFAVTTADDGLEPIVAFGEGGADWLEDEGHPFHALLKADLALGTWVGGNGTGWISEVRHGAMLQTAWNQQKNTYGNYRYNLYLPYKTVAKAKQPRGGAGASGGLVVDRQGDWLLRQKGEGAAKTLWLESKHGTAKAMLARVETATATVTNTWWDAYAGPDGTGGAWVTEVGTVGGEHEFRAFVNAGRAYWEEGKEGMLRLWTAPCSSPEEKTLLAETETVGGDVETFGARRWRRGAIWTEGDETVACENGKVKRLGKKTATSRRGGEGTGLIARGEYDSSGSGEYDTSGSGDYDTSGSGEYDPDGDGDGTSHWHFSTIEKRAPAGCVATAGGQLMNWWRAPTGAVGKVQRVCTAFGKTTNMTTKGGTYAWNSMGGREPRSRVQGFAVSKLLHDIAVACKADFEEDGTAMAAASFAGALTELFGYESAQWTGLGNYNAATLQRAVVPNLDAGAPVMLGIYNSNSGHEVVADGCGTDGGAFAVHLNFGWGGIGTMWYKPPTICPVEGYDYPLLNEVVYNVAPKGSGEIVSGRVLGPNGRPVSRPSVTIKTSAGAVAWQGTGGADGIYAWRGAGAGTYTVGAAAGGATGTASASVQSSTSSTVGNALCDVVIPGFRTAGMPTLSVAGMGARGVASGTITEATAVSLSCGTPGGEIRYTLDGSEPTPESPLYESPIVVQSTTTLKAAEFADGMERGETQEWRWTFDEGEGCDAFASARTLVGASGCAAFGNAGYGKEQGEPVHSPEGYPGGASAWATWTAPSDGRWLFKLGGTTTGEEEMDTQLAVYTGTAVSALTRVAANDDAGGTYSSRLVFAAAAGPAYRIAMASYQGEEGEMILEWGTNGVETAEFSQDAQFMPASGGTLSVQIDSTAPWTLPGVCDWMTAAPESGTSGDTVTFTVEENDSDGLRTGSAFVQAGDDEDAELGELQVEQATYDFCTNRATAVARALAENKRILLVYGREGCGNTRATLFSSIPSEEAQTLVEQGYVVWYSNCDRQNEGRKYSVGSALPTVAILHPQAMETAMAATNGYQSARQLQAFLAQNAGWAGLLKVDTESLADATAGEAYRAELSASGGTPPYSWGTPAGRYEETPAAGSYAATGTARGWQADDGCWDFALPFAFPFFGHDCTNAKINSNGTISFGNDRFTAYAYSESTFTATPAIAVLWADLKTTGGDIYTETGSDWAKIRWQGSYYPGGEVNFSATLWRDGTIALSYGAGNESGGAIGISAGDGATWMLSEKSDSGSMADAGDIVFRPVAGMPEWLELTPDGWLQGTPGEGGEHAFTVEVTDSAGLTASRELTLAVRGLASQRATFDPNGGTCETGSAVYAVGEPYGELPVPTKGVYPFTGWFTAKSGGEQVTAESVVTAVASRTLYARWAKNQTVTFDANGGTCKVSKKGYWTPGTYDTLPEATQEGNAFVGWYTAASGGTKVKAGDATGSATSRTLYAHWTRNQTVTFDANGGTCNVSKKGYWIAGTYATLPTATNGVKPFVGWFTAASGGEQVKVGDTVPAMSARTLYAHWAKNQAVTFNANGGTCATKKKGYWTPGTYGTLPTPTNGVKPFVGWFTAASGGTQVKVGDATTDETSRTLYAHWAKNQTVTFDANGGTCKTAKKGYWTPGTYATLPVATRDGFAFAGWFTAAEGGTQVKAGDAATSASARTLYAHWTAARQKGAAGITGIAVAPGTSGARPRGASGDGEGACILLVDAQAGVEYEVQWTGALGGEWETVKRWTAEADGEAEVEVPLRAGEGGAGFYRVAGSE